MIELTYLQVFMLVALWIWSLLISFWFGIRKADKILDGYKDAVDQWGETIKNYKELHKEYKKLLKEHKESQKIRMN